MAIDLEISPTEALETLRSRQDELIDFADDLLVRDAKLRGKNPIRLYLKGSATYKDDGTKEESFSPKLKLAYTEPGYRYERPLVLTRGKLWGGGTYERGTRTIHEPKSEGLDRYEVRVSRSPSIGLIAVALQQSYELGIRPYPSPIQIREEETQLLLGDSFTLIALANGLDPEKIH